MDIRKAMRQEFEHESGLTRNVLQTVPDSLMSYQAAADMRPVRWNVSHLVDIPSWLPMILCEASFDVAPVGEPPHETPLMESTEAALAKLEQNLDIGRSAIESFDLDSLEDDWSLLVGGQPVVTHPRHLIYRLYVSNHIAHHRGHLLSYLRISGVETPRLYG